jgi:competence protein ComEC
MRTPLVVLVASFLAGVLLLGQSQCPFLVFYGLAIVSLTACCVFFHRALVFEMGLLLLAFSLGASLMREYRILPHQHIARQLSYRQEDGLSFIKGHIVSLVTVNNDNTSFVLETEAIQKGRVAKECCGRVLVSLKGEEVFHYGDSLIVRGKVNRLPWGYKQQGYRRFLQRQGIYALMRLKHSGYVVRCGNKGPWFSFKSIAYWFRGEIQKVIHANFSPLSGAIVEAMLLGDKTHIPAPVYSAMMKTGTVHILVVSGFNVGIVVAILVLALKVARVSRSIRPWVAIPFITMYTLVTGASTPVVRAAIMATIFLLSYVFQREPNIFSSICIAAWAIVWNNPFQLFDIGFQLSFVSVLAIVCLYPRVQAFVRADSIKNKFLQYILNSCLVSFSAWVGTFGIIIYYFRTFSPITVLANLCIVPLATLITVSGFSMVLMNFLIPPLGRYFVYPVELFAMCLLKVNQWLVSFPGACFYL